MIDESPCALVADIYRSNDVLIVIAKSNKRSGDGFFSASGFCFHDLVDVVDFTAIKSAFSRGASEECLHFSEPSFSWFNFRKR